MQWLRNLWQKVKQSAPSTQDTVEAAIFTEMWTAGYCDAEIEMAIHDYRESLVARRPWDDDQLA